MTDADLVSKGISEGFGPVPKYTELFVANNPSPSAPPMSIPFGTTAALGVSVPIVGAPTVTTTASIAPSTIPATSMVPTTTALSVHPSNTLANLTVIGTVATPAGSLVKTGLAQQDKPVATNTKSDIVYPARTYKDTMKVSLITSENLAKVLQEDEERKLADKPTPKLTPPPTTPVTTTTIPSTPPAMTTSTTTTTVTTTPPPVLPVPGVLPTGFPTRATLGTVLPAVEEEPEEVKVEEEIVSEIYPNPLVVVKGEDFNRTDVDLVVDIICKQGWSTLRRSNTNRDRVIEALVEAKRHRVIGYGKVDADNEAIRGAALRALSLISNVDREKTLVAIRAGKKIDKKNQELALEAMILVAEAEGRTFGEITNDEIDKTIALTKAASGIRVNEYVNRRRADKFDRVLNYEDRSEYHIKSLQFVRDVFSKWRTDSSRLYTKTAFDCHGVIRNYFVLEILTPMECFGFKTCIPEQKSRDIYTARIEFVLFMYNQLGASFNPQAVQYKKCNGQRKYLDEVAAGAISKMDADSFEQQQLSEATMVAWEIRSQERSRENRYFETSPSIQKVVAFNKKINN